MRMICSIFPFLFFSVFSPVFSFAQNAGTDTSFRQAAINKLVSFYHDSVGQSSNLYNGMEYELYPFPFGDGHQYFETTSYVTGDVHYNGVLYSNVPLRYEIVRDELLLLHYDSIRNINLVKEQIDSFSIGQHKFLRIPKDSVHQILPEGFYQQLHPGKTLLLAKHTKTLHEAIEYRTVMFKITYRKRFYVLKDNVYHPVKNKKDLLRIFRDKKNELQKYIKQDKLNFRKNTTVAITKLVAHYDQLIK